MGSYGFDVNLTLHEALKKLDKGIIKGNVTECLNVHEIKGCNHGKAVVVVYGKHYYRVGNLLTLTVCLDESDNKTHVHVVAAGDTNKRPDKSENSVSDNFVNSPRDILKEFILNKQ